MQTRQATADDAVRIAEIYNWYVLNTIITFETEIVTPQDMQQRINPAASLARRVSTSTGSGGTKCSQK
jgi:L-amino acid N-acyltransferase YncA